MMKWGAGPDGRPPKEEGLGRHSFSVLPSRLSSVPGQQQGQMDRGLSLQGASGTSSL